MAFELPPLPYAFDALEPYIDTQTMQIHHGKHHGTYVSNLNAAIEKHPELAGKSLEELVGNHGRATESLASLLGRVRRQAGLDQLTDGGRRRR